MLIQRINTYFASRRGALSCLLSLGLFILRCI
nr:MAG TPA: hypothetical protein [Caudoviricetes sp.]